MIDVLTLMEASSERQTYWRLNREAGAKLLDELITMAWEDCCNPGQEQHGDPEAWETNYNMDGDDDIEECGGPEGLEQTHIDECGWYCTVDLPGRWQEYPARLADIGQWEMVEVKAMADRMASEEELFGFTFLEWEPEWTCPRNCQLLHAGTHYEEVYPVG